MSPERTVDSPSPDSATADRQFLARFAVLALVLGMGYVAAVTFIPVPKDSQQYASTALGFILGTILAAPIGFYYGASKSQPQAQEPVAKDQPPTVVLK